MNDQSWVTLAATDTNAWEALVLAKSLRRTFTTRKLTVVITQHVTQPMKVFLQQEFDLVAVLHTSELELRDGTTNSKLLTLWVWNLKAWGKCVFLSSNTLVLENSDEIFMDEIVVCQDRNVGQLNWDLFVFQPSSETFNKIMAICETVTEGTVESVLNEHFSSWATSNRNQIDSAINRPEPEIKVGTLRSRFPNIVPVPSLPWEINGMKSYNKEAKMVRRKWEETFVAEVLPSVNDEKNLRLKDFLNGSISESNLPVMSMTGPVKPLPGVSLGELWDAIAVIGMSCRFPGANSTEEYWDVLAAGTDTIRGFPTNRPYPPEDRPDPSYEAGFLKCPVDEFDAKFFGMSPREAPLVDPQQRLLLEVIWESLENANINPQALRESDTGVFLGIWQQDYNRMLPNKGLSGNDFQHKYFGNAFSATASRISYFLGLFGPNYSVESGCSSSSSGVHLACNSLRRGDISLAIASGVNLILSSKNPLGEAQDFVIFSKAQRCKTFDESADGFVRGEGCGAVVLKRYAEARRDGDNVLALIRGSALNNDGPGTSFGTPNPKAQERVFREALKNARVLPSEVSYVEAHGTGTRVGDPTEIYAIGQAYSGGRKDPLLVGSVKTNIGHAESCAGMAGLIKVILCLQNKAIPPHLHLKTLNPRINLEAIPAEIPMKLMEWSAGNRIAALNSFSMSGTNVHIVVQEPPRVSEPVSSEDGSLQMVTISGKSEEALEALLKKYAEYLEEHPNVCLRDIACCTNTGRANFPHRIAIIANGVPQLKSRIENRSFISGRIWEGKPKIGFLFPGQGSQYLGMSKNLYEECRVFRDAFDWCEELFHGHLGRSLKDVVWTESKLLDQTIYCQPAIFCIQYSLTQLWASFGITPDYVLGHSVGEFAAAACAGILSLEDAMKLVVERSRLLNPLEPGSMMAVKCTPEAVRILIKKFTEGQGPDVWVDLAAVNSEAEVVVSGSPDSINKFEELCRANRLTVQKIPAAHAFHSRNMDSVLPEYGRMSSQVTLNQLTCVYVSGTLAQRMEPADFGPTYWQRHLRDTVQFSEAVKLLWTECKVLLEIGVQPILLGLSMANIPDSRNGLFCPSLRRNQEDRLSILTTLSKLYVAGLDLSWKSWFEQGRRNLALPTYPFQRQKFWYVPAEPDFGAVDLRTKLAHPLLGRRLLVPVSETIFCHTLNLTDLPYVEDHKVGERIILPGAAYLECMMAAGREVLFGGGRSGPMIVENLSVEAAMELGKPCHVQTVLTPEPSDTGLKYRVSLHRQVSGDWKRHSTGWISTGTRVPEAEPINLEAIMSRLRLTDGTDQAYRSTAEAGIQLGPRFRSLVSAWTGTSELLTQVQLPQGAEDYICHPILLDGMIQTYAFRRALTSVALLEPELELPIRIGKFVWFSKALTKRLFVYTRAEDEGAGLSLYNDRGELVAAMEGLELLKTSLGSFLRGLGPDELKVPAFLETVWRPKVSPTGSRVDTSRFESLGAEGPYMRACRLESERYEREDWAGVKACDRAFFLYLVRGIQEAGWGWPAQGGILRASDWRARVPSVLKGTQFIESVLQMLRDEGFLELEAGTFRVIRDLPGVPECDREIRALTERAEYKFRDRALLLFTKRWGLHFTSVLEGKMSALALMFPEDPNEVGAFRFYTEAALYNTLSLVGTALVLDSISFLAGGREGVVRILEVGAGSGKSTLQLLDKLAELGIPAQYTFTDISPTFVAEAKKRLPRDLTYGTLNIEEDPLAQGYPPNHFDIILGGNVIHATADIKEALTNVRKLLRKDGAVILSEPFRSSHTTALSFGLLDGWWRFKDFRQLSPIVSGECWKRCLAEAGYDRSAFFGIFEGRNGGVIARNPSGRATSQASSVQKVWVLVGTDTELREYVGRRLSFADRRALHVNYHDGKLLKVDENLIYLNPQNSGDCEAVLGSVGKMQLEGIVYFWIERKSRIEPEEALPVYCRGLLSLTQALLNVYQDRKIEPRLVAVTRGLYYIGDATAGSPNGATAWGLLKSLNNEVPDLSITLIDTDQDGEDPETEAEEVFTELWSREKEPLICFRAGKKFVQRLIKSEGLGSDTVPLPTSDRFELVNPPTHAISDLSLVPAIKLDLMEAEVEVGIHACALNFRDLLMVLQPEGFTIPDYMSTRLGYDIAGVISRVGPRVTSWRVGDEVYGFTSSGGLASHAVIRENACMRKPKGMTFSEAATVPCAFWTVFYSLNELAKLTSRDRVLIHAATGGVGLAAIQVAQAVGAEIYATAGSRRKRAYLRSLGIQNVYHSRNTDYGAGIAKDSNGQGVTVVLNSLTGPNFKETSLQACAGGGRFLEIGAINIWTKEEVTALRPDVQYFMIDLAMMLCKDSEQTSRYSKEIESAFAGGRFRGLPHESYPLPLVKEAFRHFQEAKHIGKIVLTIPQALMTTEGRLRWEQDLFNKESTYLVTGGLGGLGLEVAKWMTRVGGKHIVLAGRNPPSPSAQDLIERLNGAGANVITVQADVGNLAQCQGLLESIKGMGLPALRGIMHAAGVLRDGLVPKQDWDTFSATLVPKVYGGWNLHSLTLASDLDFFLMFSSVSSILGIPGQSNHAAGNGYLDSLAHYRRSLGLPALSINFGAWSDVGAAARGRLGTDGAYGTKPFSPNQGIRGIGSVMRERRRQVAFLEVGDSTALKQSFRLGNFWDEIEWDEEGRRPFSEEQAGLIEAAKAALPQDRLQRVQDFVKVVLMKTLRLPQDEEIDPDQNFTELGMDSLMAMEMRNQLQGVLGDKILTVSALQKKTRKSLAAHIANSMGAASLTEAPPLDQILGTDAQLPPDIIAAELGPCQPSKFKEILLTGATGHLGSHFVPELLKSNLTVHCLVRAGSEKEGRDRLLRTFKRYEILDGLNLDRVRVIVGDVRKARLGIEPELYARLGGSLEAVVHCAIKSNHLDSYAEGGEHSMRNHNVVGMVNVLRFAGLRRTKPVLYAATLLTALKWDSGGDLEEECPVLDAPTSLRAINGYALSKLVSEKLASEASKRGIPVTVLRYPSILGSSRTGIMPLGYDHVWNIYLSCIRVRKFPGFLSSAPIMSVDNAAYVSTRLFLADSSETGVYNLTTHFVPTEEEIRAVFSKYGADGDFVSFSEWKDLVFEDADRNTLGPLKRLYEDEGESRNYSTMRYVSEQLAVLNVNKLSSKLKKNLPNVEDLMIPGGTVLERCVDYYYKNVVNGNASAYY